MLVLDSSKLGRHHVSRQSAFETGLLGSCSLDSAAKTIEEAGNSRELCRADQLQIVDKLCDVAMKVTNGSAC